MTQRQPCDISLESSRTVFSVYTRQKTVGCKVRAKDQSAFFVASVATVVASQIWGRAQPFVTSLSKYYRNVRETPVLSPQDSSLSSTEQLASLANYLCTHGFIIPIPEVHNKDMSLPSNYRGITLLSVIGKVFEKVLLLRLSEQQAQLNPLQGGFRAGFSCLHSAFIFQEAVSSMREQVCVVFLDVKKAFDTTWHVVKLFQNNVPLTSGISSTTGTVAQLHWSSGI